MSQEGELFTHFVPKKIVLILVAQRGSELDHNSSQLTTQKRALWSPPLRYRLFSPSGP